MAKGKQQQPNPPADNGDDGQGLAGSTLEDYFASHKVSGLVSQHLLNIPAENDVMAAEKAAEDGQDSKGGPDRMLAKEGEARQSEQEEYEDDYESESSAPKVSELVGMSLSEYLHVKEDGSAEAQEKVSKAGSVCVLPPPLAAAAKKTAPMPGVSGMSLDHYLGASATALGEDKSEDNGHTARADRKPSPKVKRKGGKPKQNSAALPQAKASQQPFSVKGSGIIHGAHSNASPQHLSSDEESGSASSPSSGLTPFQRRQKRKDKAKSKQQRNAGGGSSVSKTILMAEAASSPSATLSVRDREKRKGSLTVANTSSHSNHPGHHGSHSSAFSFQPPLPKLAVSPSIRSLSHHNAEDTSDDTTEKLPPL
ncbi:hypothetical protein PHYPSEUDO_013477 [Phytophthora pseudosyringae]|uniref:Uncharacterized protein n=1 Tax=Phytophthora pseudosyringae TaxID=221518 RepID=A0A8T1WMN1_9STRA|nr:hypothetical protein PHYPSEUDO_013477 [Phytophthora pseudosyringae]